MSLALISRPWNNELSNANAASMCSGSENSTYAKLVDINRQTSPCWQVSEPTLTLLGAL